MKKSVALRVVVSALLASGALSFAAFGDAAVPAGLTEQGRLFDASGEPVSGPLTFVFSVYADEEGGAALWSEEQQVTLDDGYFSARLGDDAENPFPAGLFNGAARYLGIRVGADPEMTPRQSISSVPYAFLADRAEVATNVTGDITPSSVTVNGVNVIDSTGKLAGFRSIVQQVSSSASIDVGGVGTAQATCPANHVLVGGGCYLNSPGTGRIKQSAPDAGLDGIPDPTRVWECTIEADPGQAAVANAVAICLPD